MNSVPESAGQLQLPITCTIYKGTTLPHIVVKRKLQLTAEGEMLHPPTYNLGASERLATPLFDGTTCCKRRNHDLSA
jgi:hypothetical protein